MSSLIFTHDSRGFLFCFFFLCLLVVVVVVVVVVVFGGKRTSGIGGQLTDCAAPIGFQYG